VSLKKIKIEEIFLAFTIIAARLVIQERDSLGCEDKGTAMGSFIVVSHR
jgi:hypothetical protein